MEYMQIRLFLAKSQTLDNNIFDIWNLLGDMLTQAETGYVNELRKFLEETSSKKYTITTTLLGKSAILIEISGLSEKDQLLPFLAKKALLEDLWVISQSYCEEGIVRDRYPMIRYALRSMAQDVQWEELKQRESATNEAMSPNQDLLAETRCKLGLKPRELNSEERMWTRLLKLISALKKFLKPTKGL
jgi:hypothetical protein